MCAFTAFGRPSGPLFRAALPSSSLALAAVLAAGAVQAADWPQFNLNAQHSGASAQETTLHAGNVATLHMLYSVALPAVADGAPAFLSEVTTPSGVKGVLFLTTKDGRILACDAATGAILWSKQPATTPRYTTSMPAIDPSRLYVYSYALDGKVHKYQVGDGTEITTGGWPEVATLKPDVEKSSPGLTVATVAGGTQYLYVGNGGYPGDAGDYQGHITAIDLATGAQKVFNAACSDQTVHFVEGGSPDCVGHVQTAIWARSGVVYDSDNEKLFMATGNGDYDGNMVGHEWADSVFALHTDGTGSGGLPIDSYTPTEFVQLNNTDEDLGSTAPAVLPTPPGSAIAHLGVQSGKDAQIRLLNLDNLSTLGGPGHLGGEIQKIAVPQGGVVLTAPAAWTDPVDGSTWTFIGNNAGLSAFQVTVNAGNPTLTTKWTIAGSGSSPLVANGILYWTTANKMRALNPRTGALLWSDSTFGGVHWESSIVIEGKLYGTDENGKLWSWAPNAAPLDFYTLPLCRVVDTRGATGPFGGPALAGNGAKRRFAVAGQCGIPADALAIAGNVTVVSPTTTGDLRLGPSGFAAQTATIDFKTQQALANNAIISLTGDPLGSLAVQADLTGTVHLVVDVVGYFK